MSVRTQPGLAGPPLILFVTFGGAVVRVRAAAAPLSIGPAPRGAVCERRARAVAGALLWPRGRVPCPGRAWQGDRADPRLLRCGHSRGGRLSSGEHGLRATPPSRLFLREPPCGHESTLRASERDRGGSSPAVLRSGFSRFSFCFREPPCPRARRCVQLLVSLSLRLVAGL